MLFNILLSKLTPYVDKTVGDHQCGFNVIDHILIRYSAHVRFWRKNGSIMGEYISYL